MKLLIATLAGTAALALAGTVYSADPARSADAAGTDASASTTGGCFRTQEIRNHTVGDSRTLYISTERNEVFRLDMAGSCLSTANSSDPLIIDQIAPSGRVCRPLDMNLKIGSLHGIPSPCIIDKISKLSEAEAAALPRKIRP